MTAAVDAETVLVIDDQEFNRQTLSRLLRRTGYKITSAASGEEALETLQSSLPDLILLDIFMTGMTGIEVCRHLKADARLAPVPVIFLSAAADKNLIVEAMECGGVDYVTKPFNQAELLARVRTHLALKRSREQARQLAEDKDELLGILTHDLGNYHAGIHLNALALQRNLGEIPPHCARLLANVLQSTELINAFLNEFLANQSAERRQMRISPVDLNNQVAEAILRHTAMATGKRIAFKAGPFPASLPVLADPDALARLLDNLVSNALKFTAGGRSVGLDTAPGPPGWAHFTVWDEGPGFTPEDCKKMFHRYGRLSARPTNGEPSTGLGLSIVKRLAEGMKGRIEVESVPGQGARLTVWLPAAVV